MSLKNLFGSTSGAPLDPLTQASPLGQQLTTASTISSGYASMSGLANTTASTTGIYNMPGGSYMLSPGTFYTAPKPPPNTLQALQMLPPGWRYVRWKAPKSEGDEATVECIPIIGIGVKEGTNGMSDSYNYLLAEYQPNPYGTDWEQHVAVLSPVDTYAEDVFLPRAREKYREHRARQVAAVLMRQNFPQAATK